MQNRLLALLLHACNRGHMDGPDVKRARHGAEGNRAASPNAAGQMQDGQAAEGPATHLSDLPDVVFGLIWARLDRDSRIAFRRTCRLIRDSPQINAVINSLSPPRAEPQGLVQALLAFPRTARLRRLRLMSKACLPSILSRILQSRLAIEAMASVEGFTACVGLGSCFTHVIQCCALSSYLVGCNYSWFVGQARVSPRLLMPKLLPFAACVCRLMWAATSARSPATLQL